MSWLVPRLVSGSVTHARRANGSHLHQIDGYSVLLAEASSRRTGAVFSSVPFRVGGRTWELLLYPNGFDADHRGFVAANLRLAYEDEKWSEAAAAATYRVSILDAVGNAAHSRTVGPWRRFEGGYVSRSARAEEVMKNAGVYELVAVEVLLASAPFVLEDDCLNVLCDVSMLEMDSKPQKKWFMRRPFGTA